MTAVSGSRALSGSESIHAIAWRWRRRFAAACVLLTIAGGQSADAQETLRIAAVVNEDVISMYDLNARITLAMALSKMPNTRETRQRLAPQVLRGLIDEKLKLQEAKRLNIAVPKTEVDQTVEDLERRNGLPKGGLEAFLQESGARTLDFIDQIESEVVWGKVINQRYARSIRVSEEEIDAALSQTAAKRGQPEYLTAEIFLPVEDPKVEAETAALAERLVQQLTSGAAFQNLARGFSQSASAAVGGDLGWVTAGQLSREVDVVLRTLNPGEMSTPIRSLAGFHIVLVRDRRISGASDTAAGSVVLHQVVLALPPSAGPAEATAEMERAKTLMAGIRTCESFDQIGKRMGSRLSGPLGRVDLDKLPPDRRTVIGSLPELTPSAPMRTADGIAVYMVCEREKESAVAGERERISRRITNERLATSAQQLLRDLRRAAFIDIRQ